MTAPATSAPGDSPPATAAHFDALHAQPDPFGYHHRWYERRKRALLLAALPEPHYDSAWEFGCSNGALTAALAPRCARLLATDLSPRAVVLAAAAVADQPHVRVRQATHPGDWPEGRFDLVVFGEVGYYLDAAALATTLARIEASLAPGGTLVACHWRAPIGDAWRSGDAVHAAIHAAVPRPVRCRYVDDDLVLEAWGHGATPAQREGLR